MEKGRGICTVKVTQSITICHIYQKSNWTRRPSCWHSETPLTALIWVQKDVGYVRSRRYEFIPSGHRVVPAGCTAGRMLPDPHNSSQNIADNCNVKVCSWWCQHALLYLQESPLAHLNKQFRIQGNTVRNGFDLINPSQQYFLRMGWAQIKAERMGSDHLLSIKQQNINSFLMNYYRTLKRKIIISQEENL